MTAAATPAITLETAGRRIYARGNTYPLREQLRDLGGHWDAEAKAWWVGSGKRSQLEKLVEKHSFRAEAPRISSGSSSPAMVAIEGNTYPVRDQIRALGGRWDGASKVWMVPAAKATEARKLVRGAGAKTERRSSPRQSFDMVGERGAYSSQFEGTKADRKPHRDVGDACWLKHCGQLIAVVVCGYDPAGYVSSAHAEDMGHYGMSSGYYGAMHYRAATAEEFAALQERTPRAEGICAA